MLDTSLLFAVTCLMDTFQWAYLVSIIIMDTTNNKTSSIGSQSADKRRSFLTTTRVVTQIEYCLRQS